MEIKNKDKVVSIFGYWPEFADAKIAKFVVDNTNTSECSIELTLSYIDNDKGIKQTIQLLFSDVSNINLNQLKYENIIDILSIKKCNNIQLVELEACYGIHGQFNCTHIEVLSTNT